MSTFYFVAPFLFKTLVRRCGKLPLAISVALGEAAGVGCFGLAKFIPNNDLFFTISVITRILIGLCSVTSIMTLLLMATTYFERSRTYLSVCFLGIQLAEVVAPLWTGLLYNYCGYVGYFLTLRLLPLISGLLLCYFRPHE